MLRDDWERWPRIYELMGFNGRELMLEVEEVKGKMGEWE
jgi:hypothetical protein